LALATVTVATLGRLGGGEALSPAAVAVAALGRPEGGDAVAAPAPAAALDLPRGEAAVVVEVTATAHRRPGQAEVTAAAVPCRVGGGEAVVMAVTATARGRPGRGEVAAAAAAAAAVLCLHRVAPESAAFLKATRRI